MPDLSVWERASRPPERGSETHRQTTLAASTPAARLAELQSALNSTRGHLADACAEIRRLQARDHRFHSFEGTSFAGVPFAQYWCDLILWEAVLNENPAVGAVVELGTWTGGFSLWLHAQCEARGIQFRTYDSIAPERRIPGFVKLDVFAEHRAVNRHLQSLEPVVLFCDNGNKPRELSLFATQLRSRQSLAIVHDWGSETLPEDVPDSLEMVYRDFCEEIGSISRVFRIQEET